MCGRARRLLNPAPGQWITINAIDNQGGSTKVYVNPDSSPQISRLQKATKKLSDILTNRYPSLDVQSVRPYYHPKRDPQGVISINGVDVAALKSDNSFDEVEVFWAPRGADGTQATFFNIDQDEVVKEFKEKMAEGGRTPIDISMWCK